MIIEDKSNFLNRNTSITDWNDRKIENEYLTFFHGLSPLHSLSDSFQFDKITPQLSNILNGKIANFTEDQPVTHHHCRTPKNKELNHVLEFIQSVSSQTVSINGNPIKHVCQIGIGGSISGPKAVYHALKSWDYPQKLTASFISSQDEQHIQSILDQYSIKNTLFIIASKSGTTIEVTKSIETIIKKIGIKETDFFKQCVTITTKNSPLNDKKYLNQFIFEQSVGGRFSTTSPIGTLILGLCFGESVVKEFLHGAYTTDQIECSNKQIESNIAFQTACLNVAYRNDLNWNQLGVIPYGESFKELGIFLVQLISESLGKSITTSGSETNLNTCPQIIYGLGPNAQHSFFQQLHQSKEITPCEFIFSKPKTPNQNHMLQQICGQMVALAEGKDSIDAFNKFTGNRPSTLLYLKNQSAEALGSLVATYENRVMFESFLLDINAFDQPGVELGKALAKAITKSGSDLASQIYQSIS